MKFAQLLEKIFFPKTPGELWLGLGIQVILYFSVALLIIAALRQ